MKEYLEGGPLRSATKFHERFGYHSLDDIYELPDIDKEKTRSS